MRPVQRDRVERVLRGGLGSTLVHAALAALLAVPMPQVSRGEGSAVPGLISIFEASTAPLPELTPTRDGDLPFRGPTPEAGQLPLSLDGGPSGGRFVADLARIRDQRNDLFPFVTWDLGFLRTRPWGADAGRLEFQTGFADIGPAAGRALRLAPGELQALVDRAFSRRHRWSNLQELVTLSEQYSGESGDLPTVFSEYVRQNIPQPYEDWSDPDPVYWITLMLAADDGPLVEYVARYLRRNPPNRVGTELLFLLDASAESSCDVLRRVLLAGSPELPLTVTQLDNPDAFELAVSLADAYRRWVYRHRTNVGQRCVEARIAILRRIIDTSPAEYGHADARFRLGQLLWLERRPAEAVEWWTGMGADAREQYAEARRAIAGAIADGAPEYNPSRISRILRDEERRWRAAAGVRLDHFGVLATEF